MPAAAIISKWLLPLLMISAAGAAVDTSRIGGAGLMLQFDSSTEFSDEVAYRNLLDSNKFDYNVRGKPTSLIQYNAGSSRAFEAYSDITVEGWVRPTIDPDNPGKGRTQYDQPSSLTGDLDEVRVWKVARTQTEIAAARYRSLTSGEHANLIAYYNADSWDYSQPFNLPDLSPSAWDITMAVSQAQSVPVKRLMPTILPSDAPYYGALVHVLEAIRATPHWNGTYELSLLPGQSASDASTLTIRITALPACSSPNVVISRKDDGSVLTGPVSLPGHVTLVLKAPAATATTPQEDRSCFLQYDVLQGASTLGTGLKLDLIVKTNRKPMVGDAGGAIFCDGGNSFAYDKNFTFGVPNTDLKYTIEWWAYNWDPQLDGTVYSIGNSEVNAGGGSWCNDLRTSNKTRWEVTDYCQGRFLAHAPNAAGQIQAYHSWKQLGDGAAIADATPYQQRWYHVAVTSDGDIISIYIDGQAAASSPTFPFTGHMLRGLHVCHWPFWGKDHYFRGFLDEFRVFNYSRGPAQIRSTMYQKLQPELQPGLLPYYTFDSHRDALAFSTPFSNSDPIADASGSGRLLVPGGCTPNVLPWCPLGDGKCNALEPPQHPCWDSNGTAQLSGAQPFLYPSGAPVGGYGFPVVLNGTSSKVNINLAGPDPDGDKLTFEIAAIPDPERSLLRVNRKVATVGTRLAATDTVETINVHIKCPPGTYLNEADRKCEECPLGEYSDGYSFDTRCATYQDVLWSSGIGATIASINTLAILGTFAIAAAIIFFRNAKPMVAASPTFCMLIVAGGLLGLADVYTYIGMPSRLSCALQPALVAIGFTLALGNLVLKTYRIHFIFNYARKARNVPWMLKSNFLGLMVALAVTVDIIILIVWYSIDIPRPKLLLDPNGSEYIGCASNKPSTGDAASAILIAYNALWLFSGIYLAVRIRNVKSDFNESQHIIPCIYILLLVSLILTPINYTSTVLPFRVRSIFVCFLQVVASTFLVCQMFVPKLIASVAWVATHGASSKNTLEAGSSIEESSGGARSTIMAPAAKSDPSAEKLYIEVPMLQVSSGGLLSKYTAHEAVILKDSNRLILKKFRQQPASFYDYSPGNFTQVGETEILFKSQDETLKLRFTTSAARDSFFSAITGNAKGGKASSATSPIRSAGRAIQKSSFVEA
ncbi:7 transmembrane sweet-taste receptor of 3 GCPR-domain-containing protein [Fimicolochytrium jonesii]|uniref:7 transmembrane sweet-taste receptor of 3 GCPR-domain-containing protein n=1 Tax=Fimicolochytrium jonesii TaxID=1396493 RepID=UPI0022FE800A|nr:7 transmembrane sweet-taste receptor of 3 GCPR-domain-containing protein [Fimicolochytrium jonesii]KAI8822556.1 7 transmembrane sweet-taste receptor of 3 GCPR-domain-containing protein [Fimicolochytrium jonesii]